MARGLAGSPANPPEQAYSGEHDAQLFTERKSWHVLCRSTDATALAEATAPKMLQ